MQRPFHVKVVQRMLGHASATMTLDTYGHLFEDRLDEVANAMEAARAAEREKAETTAHEVAESLRSQILASISRPKTELMADSQNHEDPPNRVSAGQRVFVVGTPDRIRTGATAVRVEKDGFGQIMVIVEKR